MVDAFGNALGNSIVAKQIESSNRNQYLAEQGAALTNKLSNSLNADLNERLENSTAEVMAQANLNFSTMENVNFASGVNFAEHGMANLAGLNTDLALKQASVANVQNRVGLLEESSANFRLSDTRRSPTPYEGISDQELQNFLGVDALAEDLFGLTVNENFDYKPTINDSGYLGRKEFLDNASLAVNGSVVNAFGLQNMLDAGWGTVRNVGNKVNLFPFDPTLTLAKDWSFGSKGLTSFGEKFGLLGGTVSVLNAFNETYGQGTDINGEFKFDKLDGFREFGKAGVDITAALTGVTRFATTLGRFSPLGVAYTIADIGVQNTPSYIVQFGSHAGEEKTGWTKLLYAQGDIITANQQINPNWKPFEPGKF